MAGEILLTTATAIKGDGSFTATGDESTGAMNVKAVEEKSLVMSFVDVALAPAQTLAGWKIYLGIDSLTSMLVLGNTVVLYGIGEHAIPSNLFNNDTNITAFLDYDRLLIESPIGDFLYNAPNLALCKLNVDTLLNNSIFLYANSIKNLQLDGTFIDGYSLCAGGVASDGINNTLETVNFPNAKRLGSWVLSNSDAGDPATFNVLTDINTPEVVEIVESYLQGSTFTQGLSVILPKCHTIGANFCANTVGINFIDISNVINFGAGGLSGITGGTITIKVHPTVLTNADYIAFKAANTITEIVAYPEGWLSASELHIGEVGGNAIKVDAVFTRPANVTAYTANDVVSNNATTTTPLLIQNIFRVASGSGYLSCIKLSTNLKSITPRFRVHLYNVNTATVSADNAPYKEIYADASKRVKYFDLPAMTTAVDTTNSDMSRAILDNINSLIVAASASRDLYIVLECLDAFTPASGQSFTLTLYMDNN